MNMELFYQGIKIGLAVSMPIGPIALICIRKSLQDTLAVGLALALGVATADSIYAILGALSLSTVNQFLDKYQFSIELVGVAVILYLGISSLKHGIPKTVQQECSTSSLLQTYFSMLIITLTSPMTIILFAGVFAGMGVDSSLNETINLAPITLGVFISAFCWFSLLSALVIFCKSWFTNKHIAWINTGAGILLISFGLHRLYTILTT